MPDTFLALGGFVFADPWSVPERIPAGGAHHLVTHKLIGGQRVVTALGPDDDAIKWKGRFRGPAAVASCQLLDIMRRSGAAVTLTWWTSSYQVVVKRFTWEFERFYEIPYEIECEVVQDLTATFWSGQTDTLDTVVDDDAGTADAMTDDMPSGGIAADLSAPFPALADAVSQVSDIGDAITSGVADVTGAITAAGGALQGAAAAVLAPIKSAVAAVQDTIATGVTLADEFTGAIAGVVAGADPGAMAASLAASAVAFSTSAVAARLSGVVGRMRINLASPVGGVGFQA